MVCESRCQLMVPYVASHAGSGFYPRQWRKRGGGAFLGVAIGMVVGTERLAEIMCAMKQDVMLEGGTMNYLLQLWFAIP